MVCKLKDLTSQIEEDILPNEKLQMVSKLLIDLDFYDEFNEPKSPLSQNELLKFLSMGWYIYSNLKNT